MHNKLTVVDIQKMQEEIEHRTCVLRPQLLKEVARTRAFGDLSENAEYHIAKQEKNANERRIRFLKNMIATAEIIEVGGDETSIGLFDEVRYVMENTGKEKTVKLVTTMRADVLADRISNESPLGKILLGKKVGDRVTVHVNENMSYDITIKEIKKGTDDGDIELR